MEIKINSNEIPAVGWVEVLQSMSYHLMLEFIRSNQDKLIFNTNRELDEDKQYAYIFYFDKAENTITTVLIGQVKPIGVYPDHAAQNAYEFTLRGEPDIERIIDSSFTNRPIAVEIKTNKL